MKARFFKIAKRLSYKSDYFVHRLGAVISDGNSVIGMGYNRRKTHPMSETRFNNIHAELSAIINSGRRNLSGCSIYVYRETKNGELAMAKPCPQCVELLKRANIQEVYYTTPKGFAKETLK